MLTMMVARMSWMVVFFFKWNSNKNITFLVIRRSMVSCCTVPIFLNVSARGKVKYRDSEMNTRRIQALENELKGISDIEINPAPSSLFVHSSSCWKADSDSHCSDWKIPRTSSVHLFVFTLFLFVSVIPQSYASGCLLPVV